jgi:plastocyanin
MYWKSAAIVGTALLFAVTGASAATINVTIKGHKFSPAAVTAHVGDKIVWTNEDASPHTSTAKTGECDLSVPPGKSATLVAKAGTFDYFCKIHPSMKGQLTVN